MGGFMQLVAYGAQDILLCDNKYHYQYKILMKRNNYACDDNTKIKIINGIPMLSNLTNYLYKHTHHYDIVMNAIIFCKCSCSVYLIISPPGCA